VKTPAVYIMANKKNGTLYVGVTSNLQRRVYEHRQGLIYGFTKKYGCNLLVFYEICETMEYAALREKKLKSGSRSKKISLIERMNPEWADLYQTIM